MIDLSVEPKLVIDGVNHPTVLKNLIMKKINSVLLILLVLVGGFFAFKIMSFLGCYVRLEDADVCWKLTAW